MDTRTEKYVAADFALAKNDIPIAAEDALTFAIDRKNDDIHLGSSPHSQSLHNLSYFADDWMEYSSDAKIHAHSMRKTEQIDRDCEVKCAKDQRRNYNRQYARIANNDAGNKVTSVRTLTNADHVYEKVRTTKEPSSYYVQDHYEGYSPIATKALINTLFSPRHKICKECAEMYSPVYTDRLIYARKPLFAVEVVLCHRDDVSCFKYCSRREKLSPILCSQCNADRDQDRMLIYSYVKTNAAGIFYSHCWPRDVFDLEAILKPSIYVISRARNIVVNTQLYHRYVNNYHVRISRAGCTPMTFRHDSDTIVDCTERISCNDDLHDLHDSLNNRRHQLKDDDNDERCRQDRSTLLLEPLLLMPELARHDKKSKIPVLRSKRTQIIRILIAYTLSFFVLASITFYVVYFT